MSEASDKYRVGERIGGGGMAEVYRGQLLGAEGFERPVAIKRILTGYSEDAAFARLFVREARIASLLAHPNITSVIDFDRDEDGHFFIVMELVEGRDLRALTATGPLPASVVTYVVAELLQALGYAHNLEFEGRPMQIVHRDVSPHNVLLSWQGGVKLTDFGIARAMAESPMTKTGVVRGKAAYSSPEQAQAGRIDHRSDLFAVGVMLHELLSGRRLFGAAKGAPDAVIFRRVMKMEVPDVREDSPHVSRPLAELCAALLARAPEHRPATARIALEALFLCPEISPRGQLELASLLRARFGSERSKAPTHLPLVPARRPVLADFTDAERDEAGRDDAGRDDAERDDAERDDAERDDAGRDDAGRNEAGRNDAGRNDAGRNEAGRNEAGRNEAGRNEAGRDDAGGNVVASVEGVALGASPSDDLTDVASRLARGPSMTDVPTIVPGRSAVAAAAVRPSVTDIDALEPVTGRLSRSELEAPLAPTLVQSTDDPAERHDTLLVDADPSVSQLSDEDFAALVSTGEGEEIRTDVDDVVETIVRDPYRAHPTPQLLESRSVRVPRARTSWWTVSLAVLMFATAVLLVQVWAQHADEVPPVRVLVRPEQRPPVIEPRVTSAIPSEAEAPLPPPQKTTRRAHRSGAPSASPPGNSPKQKEEAPKPAAIRARLDTIGRALRRSGTALPRGVAEALDGEYLDLRSTIREASSDADWRRTNKRVEDLEEALRAARAQ